MERSRAAINRKGDTDQLEARVFGLDEEKNEGKLTYRRTKEEMIEYNRERL